MFSATFKRAVEGLARDLLTHPVRPLHWTLCRTVPLPSLFRFVAGSPLLKHWSTAGGGWPRRFGSQSGASGRPTRT